jgi:CheY-like chemotaxis protein
MPGQEQGPILLVEDDPDLREGLVLLLSEEGYEVVTAEDGRQALASLRTHARPAVILLDLMLPVVDGFEFRVQQRQDPALASVPVIVLSGGGDLERKAGPLAAAACLPKPIDVPALLAHVGRFAARAVRGRSLARARRSA